MFKNKKVLFIGLIIILIIIVLLIKFNIITKIIRYFTNDNRIDKTKLRLLQYNVEFLFSDSTVIDCPGKDCDWKTDYTQDKHFVQISKIIKELKPDIFNLCEINTNVILNELTNSLNDDSYNYYLSKSYPNVLDQSVGIITRIKPLNLYRTNDVENYPIPDSNCKYTESNKTNLIKHYISKFYINGMNVIIIGVHLKAFPNFPESCSKREAEALIIQKIILKYYKNNEIIVIGDFNDFDNEIKDTENNRANSKVLDIVKGNDGYNPINYKLYNTAEFIDKDKRYSYFNPRSMIDHILVTEKLKRYIKDVFVYTECDDDINKQYNSDHYPVVVDFDFAI